MVLAPCHQKIKVPSLFPAQGLLQTPRQPLHVSPPQLPTASCQHRMAVPPWPQGSSDAEFSLFQELTCLTLLDLSGTAMLSGGPRLLRALPSTLRELRLGSMLLTKRSRVGIVLVRQCFTPVFHSFFLWLLARHLPTGAAPEGRAASKVGPGERTAKGGIQQSASSHTPCYCLGAWRCMLSGCLSWNPCPAFPLDPCQGRCGAACCTRVQVKRPPFGPIPTQPYMLPLESQEFSNTPQCAAAGGTARLTARPRGAHLPGPLQQQLARPFIH